MNTDNSRKLDSFRKTLARSLGVPLDAVAPAASDVTHIEAIPTGLASLDRAIGIGGMPRGRIVEIFGPESGGKSTLAYACAANAQALDPDALCLVIDAENSFLPAYAAGLGMDLDRTIVMATPTGEEAFGVVDQALRDNLFDVVIVDSVAALEPRQLADAQLGSAIPGSQARMMSEGLRRINNTIRGKKTCVIFINQVREKVGVMHGNPETTPGGRGLKFYASLRLRIRSEAKEVTEGGKAVGKRVVIKTVKNKVATPHLECGATLIYGTGFDMIADLVETAIVTGVVESSGAWIRWPAAGADARWNGRAKLVDALKIDRELATQLRSAVAQIGLAADEIGVPGDDDPSEEDLVTAWIEDPAYD